MTDNNTNNNAPVPDPRPYWLPDVPVEDLPQGLQAAVAGVVAPGYQDLVLRARDTMEQLAGISTIHLAHLEVLDQIALAGELPMASPEERQKKMASHARLAGAKLRAMSFLQRLREARPPSGPAALPPQRPGDAPNP